MISAIVKNIISTEKYTINQILTNEGRIYTFLNPVSYLTALDNKTLFKQFDGIFTDGSILVAAIKILYGKSVTRKSFDMTSLAPEILKYAEDNKKQFI